MTRTILVTGARGKTGREVVRNLSAYPDIQIRAGSSRPESVDSAFQSVPFDWHDQETWHHAVANVDAIYLMRPDLQDAEELVAGLVRLSPHSHVVLLSEQSADEDTQDSWIRRVEDAVLANAGRWTILRPSWFHQDLTDHRHYLYSIRNDRVLRMPSGGAPIAWVDARDIARIAVKALLDPDRHHGQLYTITGPQALTLEEVANILSLETGIAIEAVDQPLDEAVGGLPQWLTEILVSLYTRVRNGDFGVTSDSVETIGGERSRSLQDFIREHRAEWLGQHA